MKPGDKVVMNNKYYVSAENKKSHLDGSIRAVDVLWHSRCKAGREIWRLCC